jgi:hypothetical protein
MRLLVCISNKNFQRKIFCLQGAANTRLYQLEKTKIFTDKYITPENEFLTFHAQGCIAVFDTMKYQCRYRLKQSDTYGKNGFMPDHHTLGLASGAGLQQKKTHLNT